MTPNVIIPAKIPKIENPVFLVINTDKTVINNRMIKLRTEVAQNGSTIVFEIDFVPIIN